MVSGLLLNRKLSGPSLTLKYLEMSDITEICEIYSVYLGCDNILDVEKGERNDWKTIDIR